MGQIKNIKLHIVTDIKSKIYLLEIRRVLSMVDTHDLFKKLGCGARFNLQRFKEDAEKFQILPSSEEKEKSKEDIFEALDFFGTNKKKDVADSTVIPEALCEEANEETNAVHEKKKKKKRKRTLSDSDLQYENGIDITNSHRKEK